MYMDLYISRPCPRIILILQTPEHIVPSSLSLSLCDFHPHPSEFNHNPLHKSATPHPKVVDDEGGKKNPGG